MNTKTRLEDYLGSGRIKENFNLSPYLTFRTDTRAEFFIEAESGSDIIKAKKASIALKIPFFILGGGSNLAITTGKMPGLVVRNKYLAKKIEEKGNQVILTVSSGYPVTKLAKELAEAGIAGLEYHLGLPGTVGGALYMNSKWTKPLKYFGDNLLSATIIDQSGDVKQVKKSYFDFAYDRSSLQKTKEILLEAVFRLNKTDVQTTKRHAAFAMHYRKQTQPFGLFTSGCFFKNIDGQSAGKMIDQSGLKNFRIGRFHVSDKHANFIIHDGGGNPEDLKKLLQAIKNTVKQKFGVDLQEEVIVI